MEKKCDVDPNMEASEGGLKELVLRWFMETQASLILNNGNFPDWFQGFAARKDTEDLLRDKDLGSFLIRLTDKAIGYILSYKGHDRCRHFVITQNQDGQFIIAGDCQTYRSLTELIEHYKASPIQPFGEYLTSSCHQANTGELYDVVNYNTNEKSSPNVKALRTLWDQKTDRCNSSTNQRPQQRSDCHRLPPPALPPKSEGRKLTGAMSIDTVSLSQVFQAVPPVPKRGVPLGLSVRGSLPTATSHQMDTQSEANSLQRPRGNTNALTSNRDLLTKSDTNMPDDLLCTFPELTQVESRGRSSQRLSNGMEEEEEEENEEEEYSNQLRSSSFTSPLSYLTAPLKRVTCHTYSLHDPRLGSSWSEQQADSVELSQSNPLYQTSEGPLGTSSQQEGSAYADILQRPSPIGLPDDTYEQIPVENAQGNTYESLEDVKTKKSKSTWGKNNMKWKKFLPDHKKK